MINLKRFGDFLQVFYISKYSKIAVWLDNFSIIHKHYKGELDFFFWKLKLGRTCFTFFILSFPTDKYRARMYFFEVGCLITLKYSATNSSETWKRKLSSFIQWKGYENHIFFKSVLKKLSYEPKVPITFTEVANYFNYFNKSIQKLYIFEWIED